MATLVSMVSSSGMRDCSAALLGPYCADSFGWPRYSATVWIDFLNGHLAMSTRAKYAAAANALYLQAERMNPPIDLDAALLSADLPSLEAVLTASLLSSTDNLNAHSRWRLSKQFVFGIVENVVGSDTAELGRELRRIKRLYAQLRPAGRLPNVRLRAIPASALEELYDVFRPDSARNPFRSDALKWRNFAILLVLTQLGLRKGEILSLSVDALQSEFDDRTGRFRHWLKIDGGLAQQDPRARQASLKNAPAVRQLPISLALLTALDTYVSQYRGEPEHAFLFSSQQDAPLAASTVDQIIGTAVSCLSAPALDAIQRHADGKLSAHSFRHTAAVIRLQRFMADAVIDLARYFAVQRSERNDLELQMGGSTREGKLFQKYGEDEKSRSFAVNPHAIRHLQNTELFRLGVADTIISKRFNRKSPVQSYVYDHRTLSEHLEEMEPTTAAALANADLGPQARKAFDLIRSGRIQGPVVRQFRLIQTADGDDAAFAYLNAEAGALHVTPYGFCLNSFAASPCLKHLECFNTCSHLVRTDSPQEQANLERLKNRYQLHIGRLRERPSSAPAFAAQLRHAEVRLEGVEAALQQAPGALVFPHGSDRSVPGPSNGHV